ncbi:MAG: hypothetical protein V8S12_00220 [Lachnospiraceae bacterium]
MRLCSLWQTYETLKNYDRYAWHFLKNARAFQALFGIERQYKEAQAFLKRLRTEFLSLLSRKELTKQGVQIGIAEKTPDVSEFRKELKHGPENVCLEEERLLAGIEERKNRECFKKAAEDTGVILYRLLEELSIFYPENSGRGFAGRRNPRMDFKGGECLRRAGIYALFAGDLSRNDRKLDDFVTGHPFETVYPGLYEKNGTSCRLLEGCQGSRRGA